MVSARIVSDRKMRGFPKSGSHRVVSDLPNSDTKRHYFGGLFGDAAPAADLPRGCKIDADCVGPAHPGKPDHLARLFDQIAGLTEPEGRSKQRKLVSVVISLRPSSDSLINFCPATIKSSI